MRKFFGLAILTLLFSSCYHENKKQVIIPEILLSEDELVTVLTDLQLAEGVINLQRLQKVSIKKEFKDSVYMLVFENYGITLEDLTSNLNYYNNDPQHMELLSNLSKLKSEVELAAKKDTIPGNDTIPMNVIDEE
jgi:hypothetical protein